MGKIMIRTTVQVFLRADNGELDEFITPINLTPDKARNYYVGLDYTAKANMKMSGDNTELSNFSETTYSEGSTTEYATESYLARARYNYLEKYYFF